MLEEMACRAEARRAMRKSAYALRASARQASPAPCVAGEGWNPVLELHQPLRFCKPPPGLIGQRDESNRRAPDKTRLVNNAGLLSCVFCVTKLPAKH